MTVSTLTTLAKAYATNAAATENAEGRLTKHADWQACVDRAAAPKVGKASPRVAEAKRLLGVDVDSPATKSGGKYAKYGNGVTGQHVEALALLLKRHAPKVDKPTDWLLLVRQAVSNAAANGLDADTIAAAVAEALAAPADA